MKKQFLNLFVASLFVMCTHESFGQAEIQIIHNAADPAADTVDVYVNGALTLDDFVFRTATPFLSVPSGTLLDIGVAPGNSSSVNDTLKNFPVTLMMGQRYVAVANGVLDPLSFAPNPDAQSTAFTLFVRDNIRSIADSASLVEFVAVHGSSDAPTVDVIARDVATLVDDAPYSAITNYIAVPPSSYILDVTPGAGTPIVASFEADLSGLAGGTAVVFASGFLDPSANQNGPAFGLFAALANGTVVEFPAISTAQLQVIHNAADPAAALVDVYVNGTLTFDDFAFRTATPFLDLPAETLLNIGVAPGNSTSASDTLKNFEVTLANGGKYIAVANGVLDPLSFAPNPDAQSTAFTLFIRDNMRTIADSSSLVEFVAVHGSSDAPTVDVIARDVATLVDNASYSAITNYIAVPPANYILDVTPGAGTPIVASFEADLSALAGGSAVVFASGFLDPTTNQNGPAFGLFAALANGTVVEFPPISLARLQVIHNAADPAATQVDVYVNGTLLLDNFEFRTATPYIDVPAEELLNIGVAPGTSTSASDTLKNFEVTLANGGKYLAVANGVLNPPTFDPNPDGTSTAFTLFLQDQMLEQSVNPTDIDLRVIHGSSDAPTVDVVVGGNVLVDNASYSNITPYLSVPAGDYTLDITPGADNTTIVASFNAPLTALGGKSAVILASGFLSPATNQNGAAFGLLAVLADGTAILLNNTTSINEYSSSDFNLYPNPADNFIVVEPVLSTSEYLVSISNSLGQVVKTQKINGSSQSISVEDLEIGMYTVSVQDNKSRTVSKLIIN